MRVLMVCPRSGQKGESGEVRQIVEANASLELICLTLFIAL